MILPRGLRQTVQWYLDNESWWRPLVERSGALNRLGNTRAAVQSSLMGTDQNEAASTTRV